MRPTKYFLIHENVETCLFLCRDKVDEDVVFCQGCVDCNPFSVKEIEINSDDTEVDNTVGSKSYGTPG